MTHWYSKSYCHICKNDEISYHIISNWLHCSNLTGSSCHLYCKEAIPINLMVKLNEILSIPCKVFRFNHIHFRLKEANARVYHLIYSYYAVTLLQVQLPKMHNTNNYTIASCYQCSYYALYLFGYQDIQVVYLLFLLICLLSLFSPIHNTIFVHCYFTLMVKSKYTNLIILNV